MKKGFLLLVPLLAVSLIFAVGFSSRQTEAAPPLNYGRIVGQLNMTRVKENIKTLVNFGSRVTGYPSFEEAAKFIQDKFIEYGLATVSYENYSLAVPYDYGANITVLQTSEVIKAYPLWPNLIETCTIPPEGIEGPMIYGGDGYLRDYHDRIDGSIVLMNFDSWDRWTYAAEFGAKAVIFIEKETTNVDAALKTLSIPLDFPRLYVTSGDGSRLLNLLEEHGALNVNVKSRMTYERRNGINVVGYVYGSDPQLRDEVVVLSAYYDSISIVPSLSPGAEEAVGISILLELARYFAQNPPKRTVLFLALSGHNQALAGAREFVYNYLFTDRFNEVGNKLRAFVNIDLNTRGDTLGTFFWSFQYFYDKPIVRYDVIRNAIFDNYKPQIERQLRKVYNIEDIFLRDYSALANVMYEPFYLDSEPFSLAGGLGFSFHTIRIRRIYHNTPFDTYDKLNFDNLRTQAEFIFCSIAALTSDQEAQLPITQPTSNDPKWGGFVTLEGQVLEYDREKAWYKPVPNALVSIIAYQWTRGPLLIAGPPWRDVIMADENGTYITHGVFHEKSGQGTAYTLRAFKDTTDGPVNYAPDLGKFGSAYPSTNVNIDRSPKFVNTVVFECGSIAMLGITDSKRLGIWLTPNLEVRTHGTDAPLDFLSVMAEGHHGMLFAEPGKKVEVILRSIEVEPFSLLINATSENRKGLGLDIRSGKSTIVGAFQVVSDLYWLDDDRLRLTLSENIPATTATDYHNQTWNHIQNAIRALQNTPTDYETFYKEILEAWNTERSAYRETKGLMRDAINTTVFFFILLMPFAYLVERLLFEAETIPKRFAYMAGTFILFTVLLYWIHPGFHIASNVYMLLIGFVLVVLISPGIILLFSKVMTIIKAVREELLGAHFADVSRGSMFFSAFSIGIGNMRKRRFRSVLATVSIIIIVFSLMSFTSVTAISVTRLRQTIGPKTYNGLLFRNLRAVPVDESLINYLEASVGDNATIVGRATANPPGVMWVYSQKDPSKNIGLDAFMGLSPLETDITGINKSLIDGTWFSERSEQAVIVPKELAQQLGVEVNDTIIIAGVTLNVTGIYDSNLYENIVDLDEMPLAPYTPAMEHMPPAWFMILPYDLARNFGAQLMSIVIKPHDSSVVFKVAKGIADIFPDLMIYSGVDGTITKFYKGTVSGLLGWQMLIIPFIIASLTVFNIMLGAVYERMREIGTYSSLGLSPTHVSGMFLAESLIVAILGGLLGYVLGNFGSILLRMLQILPPEYIPNVSSKWVMYAVGLGIGSTVLATLYPMYKSAKLVTPSLERKWKIPTKPKGDLWEIPLPFTPVKGDIDGIIVYLSEYFNAQRTERAGSFYILTLERTEKLEGDITSECLKMTVRLAPYEAYIEQEAEVCFTSKATEAKSQVTLRIKRISGILNVWKSANRVFIDAIRKQLLLWGSVKEKDKVAYLEKGRRRSSSAHTK